MASKPPFELDDQTDEDFFDKLVEEDDDDGVIGVGTKVGVDLGDSDDSSEAKAFGDLSINEIGKELDASEERGTSYNGDARVAGELSGFVASNSFVFDDGIVSDTDQPITGESQLPEADELVSKGTSNSFSFNNEVGSAEGVKESEVSSSVNDGKSSDLSGSGIKEVNWSSFSGAVVHESNGFGSCSDFFTEFGTGQVDDMNSGSVMVSSNEAIKDVSQQDYGYVGYEMGHVTSVGETTTGTGSDSTQNLEDLYPGWKYDHVAGQWYQVEGYGAVTSEQKENDAAIGNVQGNSDSTSQNYWASADGNSSSTYYAQQPLQSVSGTINQVNATNSNSSWNQAPQGSIEYPAHMVFDPQYPGWYYDTIRQEWCSLETYNFNQHLVVQTQQQVQNDYTSLSAFSNVDKQAFENQNKQNLAVLYGENNQQHGHAWQHAAFDDKAAGGSGGHVGQNSSSYGGHMDDYASQHNGFSTSGVSASQVHDAANRFATPHYANPGWSPTEPLNLHAEKEKNAPAHFSSVASQNFLDVSQQLGGVRSSAGRPPHALVTFGFGGKLIVMKDNSGASLVHGTKDAQGLPLVIFNLMEVVSVKHTTAGTNEGSCNYFNALCQQSFPGPLVGGNVGGKELSKWIDERISHCTLTGSDHAKEEALKLLLSLLKIACQHYGKLRSLGADSGTRESDAPEAEVAKLFASAKDGTCQFGDYSAFKKCLTYWPTEAQIQATASEIQNLLVNGRKMEALQCAQEGHWWAFALILARELGDQFYASTVKQMTLSQLAAGIPLRTLGLLIAKSPGDVFVSNTMAAGVVPSPVHGFAQPAQFAGSMLDNWAENLAVITANRTENDHLVITHLGDCLWKEKSNIIAAHACYLVAEAEFESYSDSARLCLIGADHWNFPRTYASPEAIQRTELLEYSKVLGNSQFVLLPFQPYKIVYAHMLAEVGKVSESLKYCQAVYKCMKTARSPEVDAWKQILSSLEDRIKTHQRGGYSVNLAPAKIVEKFLKVIDITAQRVVGPPPVTLTTQSTAYGAGQQMAGPALVSSQSAMSVPSASMEPVTQWAVNNERMTAQNRRNSEPVMAITPAITPTITPTQDKPVSSNESAAPKAESKASQPQPTTSSRFRRFSFGTQLFQKTVGLLKPRQGQQAKLGDENKFYYDEKLKRWVEEGVEPPAEEAALPPPPTVLSNLSDYDLKNALHDGANASSNGPMNSSASSESSPGIPSNPPSVNQFSARSRMGVRSRYVDTFNKGGGSPANLFPKPSVSPIKPATPTNAKFFVPAAPPSSSIEQSSVTNTEDPEVTSESNETPFGSSEDPLHKLSPLPSTTMPRFPSVDNIPNNRIATTESVNGSLNSLSRRTASWSGGRSNTSSPIKTFSPQPLGMSPLSSAGNGFSPATPLQVNNGSEGDLHEVEL